MSQQYPYEEVLAADYTEEDDDVDVDEEEAARTRCSSHEDDPGKKSTFSDEPPPMSWTMIDHSGGRGRVNHWTDFIIKAERCDTNSISHSSSLLPCKS